LENKLMMFPDLPFSSVLGFFVGRARGLSGLLFADLVLFGWLKLWEAIFELEPLLLRRKILGDTGASSRPSATAASCFGASGEENRKFCSVFFPTEGFAASSASLSESETTRRLRRFAGGTIAEGQ
jgi:hypothetical protein